MKKILTILFLLISLRLFATDPRILSEAQDFIVPSDAPNGEYVGYVKAYPEFEMIGDAPTFVLKTNSDNIYAVSSAGLITIADNTSLAAGTDVIVVTVNKTGFSDCDINVSILCIATASCIYIDSDDGGGVGTRADPTDAFPAILSNKYYLLKRDDTLTVDHIDVVNKSNVIFGSYGTGARPVLQRGVGQFMFYINSICDNITIRDLEATTTEPYKSDPDTVGKFTTWCDGLFYESRTTTVFRLINCEIHHIYSGGQSNNSATVSVTDSIEFAWNYFHDIAYDGIYGETRSTIHSGVSNVYANKIITCQLLWKYSHAHWDTGGDGIQLVNYHTSYCHHNYVDASQVGGMACILISFTTIADNDGTEWAEVYNNYLIGDKAGTTVDTDQAAFLISCGFNYGKIYNNFLKGISTHNWGVYSSGTVLSTVTVFNNIFLNVDGGIAGIQESVYNNTFYGCGYRRLDYTRWVYREISSSITLKNFKNNIIYFTNVNQHAYVSSEVLAGGGDFDYNVYNISDVNNEDRFWWPYANFVDVQAEGLELHSIADNPDFVSSVDYHLQAGSPAIAAGIGVGLNTDYDGEVWKPTPSIGAYEYDSDPPDPPGLPEVTTGTITYNAVQASVSYEITSDGGGTLTRRGICWSTSANPITSGSKTVYHASVSSFTDILRGLSGNTTYHVRAYATNESGTSYGSDVEFTTPEYAINMNSGKVIFHSGKIVIIK